MIKRNVSAFINNSTECCCACCAYSVISGILKLFNFHITWHSPALVYVLFECVHKHCLFECVEPLTSFLALIFMGLLSIDCAALHEREIASHSWSVTLSLSLRLPFSSGPLFFPLLHSSPLFLYCLWGWPQLARHSGRAMPEGASAGR